MEKNESLSLKAKWRALLNKIQHGFPSPWKEVVRDQDFESAFKKAVADTNNLKYNRFYGDADAMKSFLGSPDLPDYSQCKKVTLNETYTPTDEVVEAAISYFSGLPNWGHPHTMSNVNPPSNIASIICASLGKLFNPDLMEGEYSWNVAKVEIESGAMLSDLIGWNLEEAGGIYTFGGTGSYLYALKLALTKVLGIDTRIEGIREDAQVLVSAVGHYAKHTCADWTGLGIKNVREIPVDADNSMDIAALKEEMEKCKRENKPIAMIVCTTGTTDAFAIDNIVPIRELIDNYTNAKGYGKPFLYADSVIGWPWMAFKKYDFKKNPLEFSPQSLRIIEENYKKIAPLHLVDGLGIDFHKTGWAPFNSSFFLVKDYHTMVTMLSRPLPPYLQFTTDYNTFIFTLETTRGSSGALAGWASLKFFGYEGYQVMLGRIIEVTLFLRSLIEKEKNIVCVNPDNYGFVTLFRVYPKHIDAKKQYLNELQDPSYRDSLRAYNFLQSLVANKLFAMLRDPDQKVSGWESPPYTSMTQGYRKTIYAPHETEVEYVIHALKSFPMSPFSNEISILLIRNYLLKVRDLVIEEYGHSPDRDDQIYKFFVDGQADELASLEPISHEETEEESAIKHIPLLAHLSEVEIHELLNTSEIRSIESNTEIFSENELADNVYIILRGKVLIYKKTAHETYQELAVLGQGEVFGEMALFEGGKRNASSKSLQSVKLLVIKGSDFIEQFFK